MRHAAQERRLELLALDPQLVGAGVLFELVALDGDDGLLDDGLGERLRRAVDASLGAVDLHHAEDLRFGGKRQVAHRAAGVSRHACARLVALGEALALGLSVGVVSLRGVQLAMFVVRGFALVASLRALGAAEADRHGALDHLAEELGGKRACPFRRGAVDEPGADLAQAAQHEGAALGDLDLLLHAVGERAGDEGDDGEYHERDGVGPVEDEQRQVRRGEEQVVYEQIHHAEPDAPQPRVGFERGDEDPQDEQQEARLGFEPELGEPERGGDACDEQQRDDADVAQSVQMRRRRDDTVLACGLNAARHGASPPSCSAASI